MANTGGADEVYGVEIFLKSQEATKHAQEFEAAVKKATVAMREMKKEDANLSDFAIKEGVKKAGISLGELGENFKNVGGIASEAMKRVRAEETSTASSTTGLGSVFSNLGNIAKMVFGGSIAIVAVNALRKLISFLKEAAEEGTNFAQSMFKLSVSVRALRQKGMDITFKDTLQDIKDLRSEFGIFTQQEMADGIAQIQLLTRNFGFSSEQMKKMAEVSAALGIVLDKDFNESAREVALFLSSGYAESMQKVGVMANRMTVTQEAMALGFGSSYLALTEQQRALAAYNVVLKNSNDLIELSQEYLKTMPGQIAYGTSKWGDFKRLLGEQVTPVLAGLPTLFVPILDILSKTIYVLKGVEVALLSIDATVIAFAASLTHLKDIITNHIRLVDLLKTAWESATRHYRAWIFPEEVDPLGKAAEKAEEGSAAYEQALQQHKNDVLAAATELRTKVTDIEMQSQQDRLSLAEKFQRDMADIERKGARKREEIARQYAQKIASINRNSQRSIASAQRRLAYDLAKIDRDTAQRRAEIEEKYQEKRLEDERKYHRALEKLRDRLIFDLEEAVRARDAKQIRKLIRRSEFEKKQLAKDYKETKKNTARQHKEDLRNLARDAAEKRRARLIAFNQQMADLAMQRQQQLQEAAIWHQQQLEDLARSMAEQRAERERRYKEQLSDLERSIHDRLYALAKGLVDEYNLQAKGAREIYNLLYDYFGNNGYVRDIYDSFIDYIGKLQMYPGNVKPKHVPGGYAEGGTFIASRPIARTFGETPELVTAIPLTRVGANTDKFFGDLTGNLGQGGGKEGFVKVHVALSPGLVGEIVEQSMESFSDVLVSVERSR